MWELNCEESWAVKIWCFWWCWRRLLRVPCTARRSNQSILKEIGPGCSLEGLMLKLKLQYFGPFDAAVALIQALFILFGRSPRLNACMSEKATVRNETFVYQSRLPLHLHLLLQSIPLLDSKPMNHPQIKKNSAVTWMPGWCFMASLQMLRGASSAFSYHLFKRVSGHQLETLWT